MRQVPGSGGLCFAGVCCQCARISPCFSALPPSAADTVRIRRAATTATHAHCFCTCILGGGKTSWETSVKNRPCLRSSITSTLASAYVESWVRMLNPLKVLSSVFKLLGIKASTKRRHVVRNVFLRKGLTVTVVLLHGGWTRDSWSAVDPVSNPVSWNSSIFAQQEVDDVNTGSA